MRFATLLAIALLCGSCGEIVEVGTTVAEPPLPAAGPTARILLVGDVMLGRGVSRVLASDPGEVFAGVRHLLDGADVVGGNLESPLTTLPHVSDNENQLEATPEAAAALAAAGFDVMALPNNHSTDAGPAGLLDTIAAVTSTGMVAVGAGPNLEQASLPAVVDIDGVTVGFLAFDATGVGAPAGTEPGVASWDEPLALASVEKLRREVDVLVVSVHGGTEYLPITDPGMAEIANLLAAAGADVVWGHGAHVIHPVQLIDGPRSTVAATSLGNFLFDQSGPDRTTGAMLEILAASDGVVAYRVGISEHPDRRVEFVEWLPPVGDAVWLHDSWWSLTLTPVVATPAPVEISGFRYGDLTAAAAGDITGDGLSDIVASFRRPHRQTPLMELRPDVQWADASGRSAHLGVYDPDGWREIWVAGTVVMPVAGLTICDGAIATVHDQLDDPTLVAAGAWDWNGFGFDTAPTIPGSGTPACADIDGDGSAEPVIVDR
jgi:poly-gamma-glutamate synthesis protein (capsule biosynthesis protein)